jgi:hypothetical protein
VKKFDLQDLLVVAGVFLVVAGICAWSCAGAAVTLGCFCLLGAVSIGRAGARERKK